MYHIKVTVKRRDVILDPQGKAIEQGARLLGFSNISHVRVDKLIEFDIDTADQAKATEEASQLCTKLLSNPIMEDFELSITEK